MKRVFIAGATGYLGRHLCAEYQRQGWHVTALVRRASAGQSLAVDISVVAEATQPETLTGVLDDIDLVVSALGITRQADGLSYWDVDYQANKNLLNEALRAGVQHFAYVHVLNADKMTGVPLIDAKQAFVADLQAAGIHHTIIAPSGYFSDVADFLAMARRGRIWLFGDGQQLINPIHGADLAAAIHDAVLRGDLWLDVGGPDTLTQSDLAALCFEVLGRQEKIIHLPDVLRRLVLRVLPYLVPQAVAGPAQFFLTAFGMDMVGLPKGKHRLADHLKEVVRKPNRLAGGDSAAEQVTP
ncbi:SDR family oxidoreductase [Pontivivens insulae]|uniref:NAD(P)-binding domain-containing protein n=1 Tax=Pontivivens insulae TaxID=1639689 RepID=A0A2R8AGB6_9RHOB|nr:SDR family oxidoreductase [Pontivivens insulae]RED10678.1 uncharacterized protein YbjT (DUF2867 family) [Pontivivens insulae]SPF31110.1 hypothetical protein POI8812_03461 [Pontivivens insulae]